MRLKAFVILLLVALVLALGMRSGAITAEDGDNGDMEKVLQKLDKILDNQKKMQQSFSQEFGLIKEELDVIKIRSTR